MDRRKTASTATEVISLLADPHDGDPELGP
jgi:hypothetical protein